MATSKTNGNHRPRTRSKSFRQSLWVYCSLLLNVLSAVAIHLFVSISDHLPPRTKTKVRFFYDLTLAMVNLAFGRFLPELPKPQYDLRGKIAIVTGANSGIGLQIATDLARQGATVYLACRREEAFFGAVNHVVWTVPSAKGKVKAMKLDTSSFDSVRDFSLSWSAMSSSSSSSSPSPSPSPSFVEKLTSIGAGRVEAKRRHHSTVSGPATLGSDDPRRIDILVHNAGISNLPSGLPSVDSEGVDTMYATNFLGSFLLTHFLEPFLAPDARVVFTSSTGHYSGRFASNFSLGPVRGVSEAGFHFAKSAPVPVIGTSLGLVTEKDSPVSRYANTKFMQCAFAKKLQERFDRDTINSQNPAAEANSDTDENLAGEVAMQAPLRRTAHAFTPGYTFTPIFDKTLSEMTLMEAPFFFALRTLKFLATDVDQGATTGSWLASTSSLDVIGAGRGGGYWERMQRRMCNVDITPQELLDRLWIRWERDAGISWT